MMPVMVKEADLDRIEVPEGFEVLDATALGRRLIRQLSSDLLRASLQGTSVNKHDPGSVRPVPPRNNGAIVPSDEKIGGLERKCPSPPPAR
jgi:hypothetical protein